MTDTTHIFLVLVNKATIGRVRANTYKGAMRRATALAASYGHSRFELIAEGRKGLGAQAESEARIVDYSYNGGRSRYATPGFEDRRAALIAAYKAA